MSRTWTHLDTHTHTHTHTHTLNRVSGSSFFRQMLKKMYSLSFFFCGEETFPNYAAAVEVKNIRCIDTKTTQLHNSTGVKKVTDVIYNQF